MKNSVEGKRENDEWWLDEMIHSAIDQKKLLKNKMMNDDLMTSSWISSQKTSETQSEEFSWR